MQLSSSGLTRFCVFTASRTWSKFCLSKSWRQESQTRGPRGHFLLPATPFRKKANAEADRNDLRFAHNTFQVLLLLRQRHYAALGLLRKLFDPRSSLKLRPLAYAQKHTFNSSFLGGWSLWSGEKCKRASSGRVGAMNRWKLMPNLTLWSLNTFNVASFWKFKMKFWCDIWQLIKSFFLFFVVFRDVSLPRNFQ